MMRTCSVSAVRLDKALVNLIGRSAQPHHHQAHRRPYLDEFAYRRDDRLEPALATDPHRRDHRSGIAERVRECRRNRGCANEGRTRNRPGGPAVAERAAANTAAGTPTPTTRS